MFSEIEVSHACPVRRSTALAAFSFELAACAGALIFSLLYPQSLPMVLQPEGVFVSLSNPPVARVRPIHESFHPRQAPGPEPIFVPAGKSFTVARRGAAATTATGLPPSTSEILANSGSFHTEMDELMRAATAAVSPGHPSPRSAFMEGNLIRRVVPTYPAIAKQLGIEGRVIIKAVINREGNVQHAEVSSGEALLRSAALEAVRQWKYRPYYLNGQAVEVETEITVNFVLRR